MFRVFVAFLCDARNILNNKHIEINSEIETEKQKHIIIYHPSS